MGAWCFKAPQSPQYSGVRRRSKTSSIGHHGSIKQRVTTGFTNWINPDQRSWEEKEIIVKDTLDQLLVNNDQLLKVTINILSTKLSQPDLLIVVIAGYRFTDERI